MPKLLWGRENIYSIVTCRRRSKLNAMELTDSLSRYLLQYTNNNSEVIFFGCQQPPTTEYVVRFALEMSREML